MPERLTPKQIREKYPGQWVALTDVDFKPGSISNFYTAVVVCGMTDETYDKTRVKFEREGKEYMYLRTADPGTFWGIMQ